MPKILVIIPAFNEAPALPTAFEDLHNYCPEVSVVLVNDASRDNTEAVALSLGLKVISLPIRLGIGGAMQTGFRWALQENFDLAVQFDGDGQHQASYIRSLDNKDAAGPE